MLAARDLSPGEDQGNGITVVGSVFAGLATLAVVGRFSARRLKRLRYGPDDWMALAALAWSWIFFGIMVHGIQQGLGMHMDELDLSKQEYFRKLLYVNQILFIVGASTVKASLLLLYRRIFVSPTFTRIIYAVGTFIVFYVFVFVLMAIFNCIPVYAFWTEGGYCFDLLSFSYGYTSINIMLAFVIWFMPMPMVWRLHLPTGQKIGVTLVFLLGLFDCGAAIARLTIFPINLTSNDFSWFDAPAYQWAIVEISTGIICSCLPLMRVVFQTIFPCGTRHSITGSSRRTNPTIPSTNWPSNAKYNEIPSASKTIVPESTVPESTAGGEFHSNHIALGLMNDGKLQREENGDFVDHNPITAAEMLVKNNFF